MAVPLGLGPQRTRQTLADAGQGLVVLAAARKLSVSTRTHSSEKLRASWLSPPEGLRDLPSFPRDGQLNSFWAHQ